VYIELTDAIIRKDAGMLDVFEVEDQILTKLEPLQSE